MADIEIKFDLFQARMYPVARKVFYFMNNIIAVREIREVGWDAYLHLSHQSVEEFAARAMVRPPDGSESRKVIVERKLLVLNAELRGIHGDVMPTNDTSSSKRKIGCAEHYVDRVISKEWSLSEQSLALKVVECASGVWMPLIARVIKRIDAMAN